MGSSCGLTPWAVRAPVCRGASAAPSPAPGLGIPCWHTVLGLWDSAPSLCASTSYCPWWSGWTHALSTRSAAMQVAVPRITGMHAAHPGGTAPAVLHVQGWALLGPSPVSLMALTALIWAGNEWFKR